MSAVALGLAATLGVLGLVRRPATRRLPRHDGGERPSPSTDGLIVEWSRLLDRLWPARVRARRDRQLPEALDELAAAVRSGHTMSAALHGLAAGAPDPLGAELRALATALRRGASVAAALDRWAGGAGASDAVRLAAAALTVGTGSGGQVARAVDQVAATLRERASLVAEVQALATQARASAIVLAVAPLAFAGLVATIDPTVVTFLVTTPVGLGCLVLGGGLEAVGAIWMRRIVEGAW